MEYTTATAMWSTLQKEIEAFTEQGWSLVTALPRGSEEVDVVLIFYRIKMAV